MADSLARSENKRGETCFLQVCDGLEDICPEALLFVITFLSKDLRVAHKVLLFLIFISTTTL